MEHFPSHSVSSPSQNHGKKYEQQKESKGHSPHEETCVCSGEDIYLSIINSIQLQLPVKPMETKLESHANEFLVRDRRCFPAWGCNIPSCCNRISCFQAFCALAMKTLNNQNISSLFRLSYSDFPVSRRFSDSNHQWIWKDMQKLVAMLQKDGEKLIWKMLHHCNRHHCRCMQSYQKVNTKAQWKAAEKTKRNAKPGK